jgi:prepilin-type processing-associated H-X9-DG protein
VLLLPALDRPKLFGQIRLEEPWDSAHNRAVFDLHGRPDVYACPADDDGMHPTETNYVMIVGQETISSGADGVRSCDIEDGLHNTLMIAETTDSGIHWAEPRDLHANAISYRINDAAEKGIRSRHPNGANVLCCDGASHFLDNATDPRFVRALTTIAGHEEVGKLGTLVR